jgi:hypothetical protein
MINWLKATLHWILGCWPWRKKVVRIKRLSDAPSKLKDDLLYVLGEGGYDWAAVMKCPGGCGKVLEMNLFPDAEPVWRVEEGPSGGATLYPSVWLRTDCECHFILRDGRIIWA